jgi:hypothetical protein
LEVIDGVLQVKVDPAGGLVCGDAGLAAEFPTPPTVPGVSPDAFNGFELLGNGYFARCPTSIIATANMGYAGATFPVALSTAGAGLFSIVNFGGAISITNTTPWTVDGFLDCQVYGGTVSADPGFDGFAYISISTDGGAFNAATPPTNFRMDNGAAGVVNYEPSNMLERNRVIFTPGQTHTFEAKINIQVYAGTASWKDNAPSPPYFEFHGQFTQTDAC